MHLAGVGRVVFWEGGSLWLALITGGNALHVHHAIQISLPLAGRVRFRGSQAAEWTSYAGAVVPPDLPHAFEAPGTVVANILFEPESAAGRAMLRRYDIAGITALPASDVARWVAPLAKAHFAVADDAGLIALARQLIADVSDAMPQGAPADMRVLRAIRHVRDHIDEPLTLERLARAAGLSPGRLRHLFIAETGVSTRAFVLWERLNRALALGFGGGMSWTEAAHAANFADSAHLSRTCRRMFGFAPTGARVELSDPVGSLAAQGPR